MSIYGQPSSETTSETEVHASFPHTLQKTVPLCARYPLPTKEKEKAYGYTTCGFRPDLSNEYCTDCEGQSMCHPPCTTGRQARF